jgi:hypothetical protein
LRDVRERKENEGERCDARESNAREKFDKMTNVRERCEIEGDKRDLHSRVLERDARG